MAELLSISSMQADPRVAARDMSRKLVASAFLSPMLEKIRHEPLKNDLFHGGFAEDAFAQQLDTLVADAVIAKMDQVDDGRPFELVQGVYEQVMKQMGNEPAATDDAASIENQSQFLEDLNLAHLKGKKGTFTIRFAINCKGQIVETKLVDSKTNATRDEILNIFNNELMFISAKHRERDVDSYYGMRFRIRNDWIKLIE